VIGQLQRLVGCSSYLQNSQLTQSLSCCYGILDRESDLPPFLFEFHNKYRVTYRTAIVAGEPGVEVSGSPEPPLSIRDRWFFGLDPLDILNADKLVCAVRIVVVLDPHMCRANTDEGVLVFSFVHLFLHPTYG